MSKLKILLYTGYANPHWSHSTWNEEGLGGTEFCVIKLAEAFARLGHYVTVSGDVLEEKVNGVDYIHYNTLGKYQGPINKVIKGKLRAFQHYNMVIATNYIHYIRVLRDQGISFDKSYFWLHNTHFYDWYKGNRLHSGGKNYFTHDKMNGVICVSKLHEDEMKEKASKAFGYTPSQSNTYIQSIDNAIDPNDWLKYDSNTKKDTILWTSSPDRGLKILCDNWDKIRAVRPNMQLNVCCPSYASDWGKPNLDQDGINYIGSLCPWDLKTQICEAEYWIYQSDYFETYCISAVEMMLGKVKLISNGAGNIKNIMGNGDRGTIIDNNPDTIVDTLVRENNDKTFAYKMSSKLDVAYNWAMTQTWDVRAQQWILKYTNK